ncbi:VQ motif-containing protein 8 [Cucumis melo var. makuwa]|uniref:VQ motif-containing protein 8 n=2 Tax=Cucumis melo TaxID=3656 RepID=A0A5D3CFH5_CUCMM|nr:VQ motif-containing protein 8 [Cucumis melo var. makuwa]TYK09116.1 VQ motif-containing protein 8 [Cucumis melo var. makuwa]
MSPPKSSQINGLRPSPLLIHNDSRLVRKPQLRQPLIIYTHSPKIIHTHPKDFMALVQRLTGFNPPPPQPERNSNDNDSTSGVTSEEDVNEKQSNCSVLKYSSDVTTPFSSPAFLSSLSPSFMDFLKALPEF